MKRRRRADEGDATYQVDAIVSLMAILLVLLLALAAATAASDRPQITDYRPDDGPGQGMTLRSMQVTYRYREIWVLGAHEELLRFDLPALIEALDDAAPGQEADLFLDGVDATLSLNPDEPGSYRLDVVVFDLEQGEWALAARVDINDAAALARWAEAPVPSTVFVLDDAIEPAARVDQAMRAGARRGSLVIPRSGRARATITRSGTNFSLERIHRAN